MGEEQARKVFTGAAEEAFDELQAWCRAHPSYTLLELEEQVLIIRQRLMSEAMSTLVAQRKAVKPPEGLICPKCGARMADKGKQSRTVGGPEGAVELSRTYYYCPSCKEGFFPSRPRTEAD